MRFANKRPGGRTHMHRTASIMALLLGAPVLFWRRAGAGRDADDAGNFHCRVADTPTDPGLHVEIIRTGSQHTGVPWYPAGARRAGYQKSRRSFEGMTTGIRPGYLRNNGVPYSA